MNGRLHRLEAALGDTEKPTADDLILTAIRWRDAGPEERRAMADTAPAGWRRNVFQALQERDERTA